MTILFDSAATVKPKSFGRGVLASRPVHRAPVSISDMQWWAEHSNGVRQSGPTDADFDRMADEAAFLDRYTRGYCL